MTKTLTMLCGIPGSGKSTARKQLLEQYPEAIVLSTDDYIEARATEYNLPYSKVFAGYIKDAEVNLKYQLSEAISNNKDIIWDQCQCSAKSRRKNLGKIPEQYVKNAVVCIADETTLLLTNAIRKSSGRNIPDNVLKSMMETFIVPTLAEGFDSIQITARDCSYCAGTGRYNGVFSTGPDPFCVYCHGSGKASIGIE